MDKQQTAQLVEAARAVLAVNDMGDWTRPTADGLYPHQWLWDSFFVAIGQRHHDLERAMREVRSPFRAQWKNGMLPHIIFSAAKGYHAGPELWRCEQSPDAPDGVQTSGITQPPMAAEAVVRIGRLLGAAERRAWYAQMYPRLLRYHLWLYRERCPREDGLPEIVLSWETGMDNSPPWMAAMHQQALSLRLRLAKEAKLESLLERFRKDTRSVPAQERMDTIDLYATYDLIRGLRHLHYDGRAIMQNHPLRIIDVTFSCILVRANVLLQEIAEELGERLPPEIQHAMRVAPHELETLWDDETRQYYNRNAVTGELIRVPSIGTLLPLYACELPEERVQALLEHLHDPQAYGTPYPVPSAPVDSPYFSELHYWQGPSWVNTNWLLIDGLRRNGQAGEAAALRTKTIDMVAKGGFYEYFSPYTAEKAGAETFSWTAALLIDLVTDPGTSS
jgi:hypothetical protein